MAAARVASSSGSSSGSRLLGDMFKEWLYHVESRTPFKANPAGQAPFTQNKMELG